MNNFNIKNKKTPTIRFRSVDIFQEDVLIFRQAWSYYQYSNKLLNIHAYNEITILPYKFKKRKANND